MDRATLKRIIEERYDTVPDRPWAKYPENEVFRHRASGKWFAICVSVTREKLGAPGSGTMDIVNLKCDPLLVGSLRCEPGIFPAWHMNKEQWVSVALDGTVPEEKLVFLLDLSYEATAPRRRNRRNTNQDGASENKNK
ncbi:MAG: MmcQ/YjbR family DNA-binding protein [Clostridia bacterium]|nr:MmcQ/YjbR family DNA-binding protein [Clostridia bacterium]